MVASEMLSTVTADRVWIGVFLGSRGARGWVLIMRIVNLNNPSYRYPEKFSVSQITAARRRGPRIDARKEIPMQDNPVALVTGANKGIGLQIAKDLAARGLTVLVGSRNLEH